VENEDWLRASSPLGEFEIRALVSDIVLPGVVHIPHGWEEAPANALISDKALCDITGFPSFKSSLCNVEKITK